MKGSIGLFISGLSLGGGVVFKLGIKHPNKFKGIIMLAPAIRNIKEDQAFSKSMAKVLGTCFGSFTASEQIFFKANKYLGLSDLAMKDELNYTGKNILGSVKSTLELMDACEADF
jgi:S-formylglutathione hydrolase FrmB